MWCIYALFMNEKTHRERINLIMALMGAASKVKYMSEEYIKLDEEYMSIPYDKHFWYNVTFRNWRKLYPELGTMV